MDYIASFRLGCKRITDKHASLFPPKLFGYHDKMFTVKATHKFQTFFLFSDFFEKEKIYFFEKNILIFFPTNLLSAFFIHKFAVGLFR
jgi:hypothetical protein